MAASREEFFLPKKNLLFRESSSTSPPRQPVTSVQRQGDSRPTTTEDRRESSVYYPLRAILTVAMLLGLTPLSNVTTHSSRQLDFRWFSVPTLYSCLVLMNLCFGIYMMTTSYSYILNVRQDINDVVLALTAPVFYLSNTLVFIQTLNVSRKLPGLLRHWDQIALRLTKYVSDPKTRSTIKIHLSSRTAWTVSSILTLSAIVEITLHDLNLPIHLCKQNYTTYMECYLVRGNPHFNDSFGRGLTLSIYIYVMQKFANFAWNFQDLFLILMALALRQNFKVLAVYIQETHTNQKSEKEWRTIREDHLAIIDLTEKLDKSVSLMFLQSYTVNLFFLCLQVSLSLRPADRTNVQMAYFTFSLFHLVARTCGVSASAASVHEQAHSPLQYLFDCPTNTYCTEVYRFTSHLMNSPIGFTGFEFFVIDRRIFLALLSVIITYELILLKLS